MYRVWSEPDGSVKITQFTSDDPKIVQKAIRDLIESGNVHPQATFEDYKDAPRTPTRAFRAAWRLNGRAVNVDMPMARDIKLGRLREERNRRLDASDKEVAKAMDTNDTARLNELRVKRQLLRDLPATVQPALDAITDPDALERYEPEWPA